MSKAKRLIALVAAVAGAVALTGCSGINASHSVSPASLLLPGLIQHESQPAGDDPVCAPVERIAMLDVPRR